MKSGCRYQRAIKQGLNKFTGSRSAINKELAVIIAEYSHKSTLERGSFMMGTSYHFFIVTEVHSQHWCTGFFCPPKLEWAMTLDGVGTFYRPDIRNRSCDFRKKVFDPFTHPTVKARERVFTSFNKIHEQVQNPPLFFE